MLPRTDARELSTQVSFPRRSPVSQQGPGAGPTDPSGGPMRTPSRRTRIALSADGTSIASKTDPSACTNWMCHGGRGAPGAPVSQVERWPHLSRPRLTSPMETLTAGPSTFQKTTPGAADGTAGPPQPAAAVAARRSNSAPRVRDRTVRNTPPLGSGGRRPKDLTGLIINDTAAVVDTIRLIALRPAWTSRRYASVDMAGRQSDDGARQPTGDAPWPTRSTSSPASPS